MSKSNKTDVAVSGYELEGSRAKAVADISRAVNDEGQDKKQVELRFVGGLIAKRLFPDLPRKDALAKGIGLAGATSPGREPKAGQAVRTEAQQPAWEASRKQWTRCAQEAGVVERKPRAPKDKKPKAGKAGKKPAATPKPKSAADLNRMLLNMAQSASGLCAKYKPLASDTASHAVAEFLSAMAKLAK